MKNNEQKRLYKFDADLYYGIGVGIFWEYPSNLKELVGSRINFGEIEGKHSDTDRDITEDMFIDITDEILDNKEFNIGLNPFDYIYDEVDFYLLEDGTLIETYTEEDTFDWIFSKEKRTNLVTIEESPRTIYTQNGDNSTFYVMSDPYLKAGKVYQNVTRYDGETRWDTK